MVKLEAWFQEPVEGVQHSVMYCSTLGNWFLKLVKTVQSRLEA
jgi:hypothetical protein